MSTTQQQQQLTEALTPVQLNQQEAYEACRTNMDFFAGIALPHVTEYNFPPVFVSIWGFLLLAAIKVRDFTKIAVGLPRGFGKTSVIKLFILYCILFTNKQFILVFGSTATLAQNIISDVCDMLDEDNVKAIFGNWRLGMEKDTQEVKKFGFRGRNIIIAALGQGGSVRGLNIKNARPDVMLFDDIQTREDADSQVISDQIERWMIGTAMKAASHKGCLYIFLANMYPTEHSLLKKLKKNPEWQTFISGGILSNGTSLWEELKPLNQLLQEYRNDANSGHPEIFLAEVLNDENANANLNVDTSKIPPYPFDEDEISAGNFIIIDPSNDKFNSDAVTITLNSLISGKPVVMEIDEGRYSPEETIKRTLAMAIKHGVSLICVESNAYQYSLLYWFNKYKAILGMYELHVKDVYSGTRSKNSRILDMFKSLLSGELIIHPSCWPQVLHQIKDFNALKTNNVDGILDCVTYIPKVLSEYEQLISINNPLSMQEKDEVLEVEDNCIF